VVKTAAAAGVEVLALSDHDTVDGVPEASATARELGLHLVPAVEISAIFERDQDLHILGYLIDHSDPVLAQRLESFRADRRRRADAMAKALEDLGFQLDEALLERRVAEGKPIGRPHLAKAVVDHPANGERLAAEGRRELSAFLVAYLVEGRPAFRPRTVPTVPESIIAIHEAGGLAVWAHPFWDVAHPRAVLATLDRFHALGLDGVECFYPTHSREEAELLADRSAELDLLTTGSADFHGPHHGEFSKFRAFSTYGREPRLGPIAA
jgi:predicted metal-dependent phosphoesterase TrpH